MNSAGTDSCLQSVRKNQPHADSSWERKEYSSSHLKKFLFFFDTTTNIIDSFLKVSCNVKSETLSSDFHTWVHEESTGLFCSLNRSFLHS